MKRRDLLTKVPAVAAGLVVGTSVSLAEGSGVDGGHEGALGEGTAQGAVHRLRRGEAFRFEIRSDQGEVWYSLQRVPWEPEGRGILIGPRQRLTVGMGDGTHRGNLVVPTNAELGSHRIVWDEGGEPRAFYFEVVEEPVLSTEFLDPDPHELRRYWGQRSRIDQLEDALRAVLNGDGDDEVIRGVLGDDSWLDAFRLRGSR